jgi:uncharacterized protein YcgI (DUF1989 family)
MNVPVQGKALSFAALAGQGKLGESTSMRAEMDLWIVMSACPMDLKGLVNAQPTDAHFEVF